MGEGETSGAIAGSNSVYVIHVTAVSDPVAIQPSDFSRLQEQLRNQQQNLVRSQWITALRETADIVDNRRAFLQ